MGDDVQSEADAPEMPKGLSRVARREFRFMCHALLELGLLTVVDGRALAVYCEAFAQKQKARKELDRLGAAIEVYGLDKSGQRIFLRIEKNPWWSIWVDACKLEKSFLIEFGLTPASRRNLKVKFKPKDDEFLRLMKSRKLTGFRPGPDPSVAPDGINWGTADPHKSEK